MKWILILLLAAAPLAAMTEAEATAYVAEYPDLAALDLMDYYALLVAVPVANQPESMAVVAGADVHVTWLSPLVVTAEGGRLEYIITLREMKYEGIVPRFPWWAVPASIGGGVVVGLIAGLLLRSK